ncbi:MAG TPA: YciI family protein [Micromonosporaceae bacterium]|nr:YciI family protein [Micromonosporaceae bacterium]
MLLIYSPPMADEAEAADNCTPAAVEEWILFDKAVAEAGIYVAGHSLQDLTTSTTVRVGEAGDRTITDGPFAETREILGGYYVLDVPNLDVALDWAARCPGARGGGSVEVRPVAEFDN